MKVHSILWNVVRFGQLYEMCSYLVQAILQCFYKNMHLPIVLCCDMLFIYNKTLMTTIDCEFHKIVSLYQVCQCSLF